MSGATIESPNFGFLRQHDPVLVRHAALAERYVFDDPNTSLIKLRQFAELLARSMAAQLGISTDDRTDFLKILNDLWGTGMLTPESSQLFHGIRKAGNDAVHNSGGTRREALHFLRMARQLAVWFHKTFGKNPKFKAGSFVPPPDPTEAESKLAGELNQLRDQAAAANMAIEAASKTAAEQARLREAAEASQARAYEDLEEALQLAQQTEEQLAAERAEFQQKLDTVAIAKAEQPPKVLEAERHDLAQSSAGASADLELDEAATRVLIDQQLRVVGWEVDSENLRYGKGTRPIKNRNLAIAEWPTANGPADYVLFSGLMPVATVEAKRAGRNIPGAIEQARRYAKGLTTDDEFDSPGGPWGEHHVPFLFATNGRGYLAQLAEESGVWFHDVRHPNNHPHPLPDWYTPEGLKALLRQDMAQAEKRLATESPDYLPLRFYQFNALKAVEAGLAEGKRAMLVAMATGTGKTRTCIGLIYRLLKAGRFRRVLFLVDRTSLGEQAENSFKDLRLDNHQTFTDIYDVKEIGTLKPDKDTKLHLATVQSLVKRLAGEDVLPVDWYDLVVIDECHRGYTLDSEMTDDELQFRNEADYISKYRRVVEHFDAVKIGLTATPALHTKEIFGDPVFSYPYRQAVIDGYLSDHEPPFCINTMLGADGIRWKQGDEVQVFNTKDRQIQLFNTEDEIHIELGGFNRKVITESFNRAVCRELVNHIDFDGPEKTLIYCVDDKHADLVVRVMKEALDDAYGGFNDAAVKKITGKADRPLELIRLFRNEAHPKVAVTVDLLTTGVDVPAIANLVFLRRVRSRILYDQMIGRATRLCPELYGPNQDKGPFRIFDAVDIYSDLQQMTEMQPVVARPRLSFQQLVSELQTSDSPSFKDTVREEILGKLRRKQLSDRQQDRLMASTGMTKADVCKQLRDEPSESIAEWFHGHSEIVAMLDEKVGKGEDVFISDRVDEVTSVERGYGTASRPEDYLEAFQRFILENRDTMPALMLVTTRPRDLTRKDLRDLRMELDTAGFTTANLRAAVRETTNKDIAATIIGYIRHVALDVPLVAHADRVKAAVEKILAGRSWTVPQRKWLERIGKQLEQEVIVDRDALNSGRFKAQGGFDRINKIFNGELEAIMQELAEAIWQTAA